MNDFISKPDVLAVRPARTSAELMDQITQAAARHRDQRSRTEALTLFEYLALYGRAYHPQPLPERYRLGGPPASGVPPLTAYRNAFDLAQRHGLLYVQGFANTLGDPHAWCAEPDDDRAIDPTWPDGQGVAYVGLVLGLDTVERALSRPGGDWHRDPLLFLLVEKDQAEKRARRRQD